MAVDCYLPDTALFDRNPDERAEERDFTHPVTGEVLASWEQGWWDPQLDVHHVMYSYQSGSGHVDHTHLQLRMYELDILEGLFTASGWRPLHATQDYGDTPVGPDALKWVGLLAPDPGGTEPVAQRPS